MRPKITECMSLLCLSILEIIDIEFVLGFHVTNFSSKCSYLPCIFTKFIKKYPLSICSLFNCSALEK